jgi:mRNA interferase MazF
LGPANRQRSLVVARRPYLPDRGDLAWINFEPQAGREQAKNRPGLVLTEREFNVATGLVIACPVTRTDRPYGSRVPLSGTSTQGFVMVEQVKSIDWRARGAAFIEIAPGSVFDEVKQVLGAILDMSPVNMSP